MLDELYAHIDEQGAMVHEKHPWWPCKKGCTVLSGRSCCSNSFFPVSKTEWVRLRAFLGALDVDTKQQIRDEARRIYTEYEMHLATGNYLEFIKKNKEEVVDCPLLDVEGACRAYESRPVICRSFGYFADDNEPHWCRAVSKAVHEHGATKVPNWKGVAERMARSLKGPVKPLVAWLVESSF